MGMEILLRIPHLSFVLQGEDTMNFKVKETLLCLAYLLACLPADAFVDVVVVVIDVGAAFGVAIVAIFGVAPANAKPMLMMLALMLMFLPYAIDVVAYVVVDMQTLIQKCGMLLK